MEGSLRPLALIDIKEIIEKGGREPSETYAEFGETAMDKVY